MAEGSAATWGPLSAPTALPFSQRTKSLLTCSRAAEGVAAVAAIHAALSPLLVLSVPTEVATTASCAVWEGSQLSGGHMDKR